MDNVAVDLARRRADEEETESLQGRRRLPRKFLSFGFFDILHLSSIA
jgi:hypothetical protein